MKEFNCESPKYGDNMLEWIKSIKEDFNADKHEVGESSTFIHTTLFPLKGIVVDVTTVNSKRAVIFQYPTSSVAKAMGITPIIKVYYPKKVEIASYDYNEHGKAMTTIRVDNLFWAYEEKLQSLGVTASFGMDMDMPFLDQQNFRVLE